MVTIKDLQELKNNDGLTLKAGEAVTYRTGWQVATEGIETRELEVAMQAIKDYGYTCGVWYSEGIYYIDKSKRVKTKREALKIGREHNQISILNWRTMGLAYC